MKGQVIGKAIACNDIIMMLMILLKLWGHKWSVYVQYWIFQKLHELKCLFFVIGWRYNVTSSFIGWAHTQNGRWILQKKHHSIIWCHSLTHWGRATYICVGKLTIIGSDNGLSPERRQAIIWTNAGILLTGPLGTNFSEYLIGIQTFFFKKMQLKMWSAKWRPFVSASMS